MSKDIQDDLYEQIDDYILGLLPASKINDIQSLIKTSDEYNRYYIQQKALIESSQIKGIPDPGDSYWNEFPDNVLKTYKKTRDITEEKAKKENPRHKESRFYNTVYSWWESVCQNISIVAPVLALVVIISTTAILIDNNSLDSHQITNIYSSVDTQKMILASRTLSTSEMNKLHQVSFNSFSFSKTDASNLFIAGQLYSKSLTYYLQQEFSKSSEILKALQVFNTDAPLEELINLVDNHRNSEAIKLYNRFFLSLKSNLPQKEYALFTIGAWVTDIKLLIITNQFEQLSQLKTSREILNEQQLSSLHAGVKKSIKELDEYIRSGNIKVTDKRKFERVLSNIENSLN